MDTATIIAELKKLQGELQRKGDYHTARVLQEAIEELSILQGLRK